MTQSNDQLAGAVRSIARVTRLLERASNELSLGHYRILSSIDSGQERAARIAEHLSLGRPTVSAAIEALTSRGLLTQSATDPDGRVRSLAITPSGAEMLRRAERAMTVSLTELCAHARDGDAVVSALVSLEPALDSMLAERRRARDAG